MSSLSSSVGRSEAPLDGGDRGGVVKCGATLSFASDNGKTWNAESRFDGGAVWFGGHLWMKQ